jgi:hypothetical protein
LGKNRLWMETRDKPVFSDLRTWLFCIITRVYGIKTGFWLKTWFLPNPWPTHDKPMIYPW